MTNKKQKWPLFEHLAKLFERGAHLSFDGAHGAAAHLGDLLVRQFSILAEEEHFLLFGSKLQEGLPHPANRFFIFNDLRRHGAVRELHDFFPQKRLDPPPPGTALQVLGGVESDAEDPGPQIANLIEAAPCSPAAKKDFLSKILG